MAAPSYPPRERYPAPSSAPYSQPSYSQPPRCACLASVRSGAGKFRQRRSVQVSMKPAATLACPIVSALDRWLATVQPAAMRWFGVPSGRDQADLRLFLPRHERQSQRIFPSTPSATRSTSQPSARRRPAHHGQGRLAAARRRSRAFCAMCRRRHASSSTPCWRRAPTLSLRPHPRRPDAARHGRTICQPAAASATWSRRGQGSVTAMPHATPTDRIVRPKSRIALVRRQQPGQRGRRVRGSLMFFPVGRISEA